MIIKRTTPRLRNILLLTSVLSLAGCNYELVSKPSRVAYFDTLKASKDEYKIGLKSFSETHGLQFRSMVEIGPGQVSQVLENAKVSIEITNPFENEPGIVAAYLRAKGDSGSGSEAETELWLQFRNALLSIHGIDGWEERK